MQSRSLPISELVTLVYLTALIFAVTLMGCSSEAPSTQSSTRQQAVVAAPSPKPIQPPVEAVSVPEPAPIPGPVSYQEAEDAFKARDYAEASELFGHYVDQNPQNAWGHYMLGLSTHKAGDLLTAELALLETVHLDTTHVKGWQNLARVYLDQGRPDDAADALSRARVLDEDNGATFRLAGRAFHQAGDLQSAADAYRDAILADESDAWAMNNLTLVLMEDACFEQALAAIARAAELRPDVALFQNNLGMALERAGHTSAALEAYTRATELSPEHARAVANRDRLEAVTIGPEEPVALEGLAQQFVAEVATWRDEPVARESGDEIVLTGN